MAVAAAIFAVVGTTATVVACTADKLVLAVVIAEPPANTVVGNSHCSASLGPFPTPAANEGITPLGLSAASTVDLSAASTIVFTPPTKGNPTHARTTKMHV